MKWSPAPKSLVSPLIPGLVDATASSTNGGNCIVIGLPLYLSTCSPMPSFNRAVRRQSVPHLGKEEPGTDFRPENGIAFPNRIGSGAASRRHD